MKKLIPIIITLGLIGLLLQFLIQFLEKSHSSEYSIITHDNSYMINEKLKVESKKHTYTFKIKDKSNNIYQFDYNRNFNKKDRIIKDIKFYKEEDLSCIYPIYKNESSGQLICNYKNIQTSYSYLKQINNKSIDKISSSIMKDNYKIINIKSSSKPTSMDKYKIYNANIPENIVFTMWKYNGFYRIDNKTTEDKIFLNDDVYENDKAYIVNNHLVSLNTDDTTSGNYTEYYVFDIANGGKKKMDFTEPVSKNMYFNGTYEGLLYYTDLTSKKQFSIDPVFEKVKEVGNIDKGFKSVKNDELVTLLAKDFLPNKVYFNTKTANKELEERYHIVEITKDKNFYYFQTEEGNFYKSYLDDINNPMLLFKLSDVSEWKAIDHNIMVVSKNMVYLYNDDIGLLPIIENNELNYNYKNICDFIVK